MPNSKLFETLIFASDSSILIQLEGGPSLENTHRVLKLFAKLQGGHPAIRNLHPGYCSLLVDFDANQYDGREFFRFLKSEVSQTEKVRERPSSEVVIPVCYDGEDLSEVEKQTGLSRDEIIHLHSSAVFTVAFLGFTPGFPYLLGLPERLRCSRKASPRLRVPAGRVAIAGTQAGIYPVESPGGWQLIGRTDAPLFDSTRDPPSLLQPGDRVRFEVRSDVLSPPVGTVVNFSNPTFEIVSGGLHGSLQGGPQLGQVHLGVSPGGAADGVALQIGNRLVGNRDTTVGYESGGSRTIIRFLRDTWFAVTGADCAPALDQQPIQTWTSMPVSRGQILVLQAPKQHLRSYVCIHGGVWDEELGQAPGFKRASLMRDLYSQPRHRLRVTFGPQLDWFDYDTVKGFFETEFEIGAELNRQGIRLLGEPIRPRAQTELTSEGISNGAVQISGGGQPIILFCEQQTTGGYPKIANVIHSDLHWLGQLRPGQKIHFEQVDLDHARRLNLQFENTLQRTVDVF